MPAFELRLNLRRELCGAGFHDIDSALRSAAVELDVWFISGRLHAPVASDGEARHYAQFLAWADTVAVGITRAIRGTGIANWSTGGERLKQTRCAGDSRTCATCPKGLKTSQRGEQA